MTLTRITASPPHDFNSSLLLTRCYVHDTVVGVGGPVTSTHRRVRHIRAPADVIATLTHWLSDVIKITALAVSTLHIGTWICQPTTHIQDVLYTTCH